MSNNNKQIVPMTGATGRKQQAHPFLHTRTNPNDPLSWYWWIKGRFLSDTSPDFLPSSSNDTLEQIAWSSIKYDHLGGPNTEHVLLTLLDNDDGAREIVVKNPNRAWDMSLSAGRIMKRVFHFENALHLMTVLMHILVLLPLTSTFMQTNQLRGNQSGIVQYLLKKLWLSSSRS